MALNVRLLEIPFDAMSRGPDGAFRPDAPLTAGHSKFINMMGRVMSVADINGYAQPFYLSSGAGGKKNVPAGKWYPVFGIGNDFWINKLSSTDIAAYYHNDTLKKIAQQLDAVIGDIRDRADTLPMPSIKSTRAFDFINQSFARVASNDTPQTIKIVSDNVAQSIQKIDQAARAAALRTGARRAANMTGQKNPGLPPDFMTKQRN